MTAVESRVQSIAPLRSGVEVCVYFLILEMGMGTSPAGRAGLGRGASIVSTPSGEREEVTFSESTVGGRLQSEGTVSLAVFTIHYSRLKMGKKKIHVKKLFCRDISHSRVFPGETPADESMVIPSLLMLPCRKKDNLISI